jgi:hypothetical protein
VLSTVEPMDAAGRLPRMAGSQADVAVLYEDANKRYDANVDVEVGGDHVNVIDVSVKAVATGASEATVGPNVVAVNTLDASDSPTALSALTLNEYAELDERSLTVRAVVESAVRVTTQLLLALPSPAVRSVVNVMTRPAIDATVSGDPFGVALHVSPVASASCRICPATMDASNAARVTVLAVPESMDSTAAPVIASTSG